MGNDERAQIDELRWHNSWFLRRDDHPASKVALLADNFE